MAGHRTKHILQHASGILLGHAPPATPRRHQRRIEPHHTFPRRWVRQAGVSQQTTRRRPAGMGALGIVAMGVVVAGRHAEFAFRRCWATTVTTMLMTTSSDETDPIHRKALRKPARVLSISR